MVKETDLYIRARRHLKGQAFEIVQRQRSLLENYIARHPGFAAALEPFHVGMMLQLSPAQWQRLRKK